MTSRRISVAITGALLVSAVAIAVFLFSRSGGVKGFPILATGAYVGVVSLPNQNESTLYVERLREGDTLLVIVFVEEFQPQTIFPERLLRAEGGEMYRPLVVKYRDQIVRLSGVRNGETLEGVVRTDRGEVGEWRLRRLDSQDLKKLESNSEAVALWVRSRERARAARLQLDAALSRKTELQERISVLKESLADQAALRARAEQRKQQLKTLLAEKKASRDRLTRNVESLAGEVELLSRITKRGQAVSLERRILQRENRWYEVNWQTEEEIGLEELPPGEAGIDITKFEQAVRQARETKSLLRERDEELRRIRELESNISPSSSEPEEEEPAVDSEESEEAPQTEPQKNLWNKLFG